MKPEKIMVTGSGGVVGSYVPTVFGASSVIQTTRADMDVGNKDVVREKILRIKPTVIIHLAAKTDVDDCERNIRETEEVNYHGTAYIAESAREVGATVIYMSTCAVFNGKKKFYVETDTPNPINTYGKTKLLGEQVITDTLQKFFIIRSGWVIGGGFKEKKFISYILKQLHEGKKEIMAVNDTFGSIAYGRELVQFMCTLLNNEPYGIYHFGSRGVATRFDLTSLLIRLLGEKVRVIPVSSTRFRKQYFASRPKYEVVKSIKKPYTKSWQESLEDYIQSEIQFTL